jgi:Rrf2 family transcriptional regulator, cysteine metabolism repressor
MKISTKGTYGLRAMVDLAVYSNNEYISLKSIAERQGISENYLEQVFATLRKANLVKSIRGSQGGYTLSESASKITVGEILRALEGELNIVNEDVNNPNRNNIIESCIRTKVWDAVENSINVIVNSIYLQDLVDEFKSIQGKNSYEFYI